MKKSTLAIGLTMLGLGISANAFSAQVLTPEKGGVSNAAASQEQKEIRVATYNIAASRVSDVETIAKAIKAIDADIISLNEVDKNTRRSGNVDQIKTLAKLTGMNGSFGKAIDFDGGEYGVGLLSKHSITDKQVIELPSGNNEQRIVMINKIDIDGFTSPILFMTTHLDWHKDGKIRSQQVTELNNVSVGNTATQFDKIATYPKILAGDFNDTARDGSALQPLNKYWNKTTKEDFRTWPASNPVVDLDHIFTHRGQKWDVTKVIIPSGSDNAKSIDWENTSDHMPVIVTMRLTEY